MGRMENNELMYFPNNPEGKITIKYYLNTDLKPKISELGEKLYPLYYQIIVKSKTTRGRSLAMDSLMSVEQFEKKKEYLNYHTIDELRDRLIKDSHIPENEIIEDSDDQEYTSWEEKRLLYKITNGLHPFKRVNFDLREVIESYELHHLEVNVGINKKLNSIIKNLLTTELNSDLKATFYLKCIDWAKSNSYDLWVILKDTFPKINSLMEKYGRCFQILAKKNINNLQQEEMNILDVVSFNTRIYLNTMYEWRDIYTDDSLNNYQIFESIMQEIDLLYFG